MLSRFAPMAAALALAATALPAASPAATVDLVPLTSVAGGIGLRNGDVHVVQPQAKLLTVFMPDTGAQLRQEALFGDAGAATSVTEAPGRGGVWIGIGSGADRGFAAMNDGPGVTTGASTAAAFGCGPVGMAPDQVNQHMIYSAPLGASACGTHGAGILDQTGTSLFTDPSFPDAFALAWTSGKLFAPAFSDDTLRRYSVSANALTLAATAPLPAGSEPDGITLGPGGNLFATLHGTGKVVRLSPTAADGEAPTVVADGLDHPVGIAAEPFTYDTGMGPVYVADSGSGRLLRIDEDGAKGWIDLPAGFAPGQLVVKGSDIWVTDLLHPRLAHVRESGPILGDHPEADPATGTVSISVDPNGATTVLGFIVAGVGESFADWNITGTGARTVSLRLGDLTPGATYTVSAHASNKRGMADSAHSTTFTYTPPQSPPPARQPQPKPPVTPPVGAPPATKPPAFAELVKVAPATRCVSGRSVVLLTLRKQPAGRAIASVTVQVGKGKARRYAASALKRGLRLRGLPARGKYRVSVSVRLADGRSSSQAVTYKACAPKAKKKR